MFTLNRAFKVVLFILDSREVFFLKKSQLKSWLLNALIEKSLSF